MKHGLLRTSVLLLLALLFVAACGSGTTSQTVTTTPEPPPDAWLVSVRESMPMAGGVAISGRVMRGTLRAQTPGELVGFGPPIPVTVAALDQQGRLVTEVPAGQDVAVLLTGIEWKAIRKGQVLAMPGAFAATTTWIADFELALDEENPERNTPTFSPYDIEFAGTTGTFHLAKAGDPLIYGQTMRGTLVLAQPLYVFSGITSTIMWGGAIVGDLTIIGPAPTR